MFSRPIRWIMALHGDVVVPFAFAGVLRYLQLHMFMPIPPPPSPPLSGLSNCIGFALGWNNICKKQSCWLLPLFRREIIGYSWCILPP